MSRPSRGVFLARRPQGRLRATDLVVRTTEVSDPDVGEVLVRNTHLSVDAAVRLRLDETDTAGYLPSYAVGDLLEGLAVGEVVESRVEGFAPGDLVQHAAGFRELALVRPADAALGGAGALTVLDRQLAPPEIHLGLLGGTGLTAWAGLFHVAELRDGDVVWVSAAAGAVGSVVAQLARSRGHHVVGSAGSPAKVAHLRGLGVAAFDHHEDIRASLARLAPSGIDVYFDNVGGAHLEAALEHLRPGGRVALCGAVSQYDDGDASGPRNLFLATAKNLTLRGFRAGAYAELAEQCRRELAAQWHSGDLDLPLTVHHGLDQAPRALVELLAGGNLGKVVVTL